MKRQRLDGSWEFRRVGGETWRTGSVPGDVYTDLQAAGVIEDLFVADNEQSLQWVGESDWVYRRTVEVTDDVLDAEKAVLRFEGLDTVAAVAVDGERVGRTANMHRPHEFDVTDHLSGPEAEVTVRFRSPVDYAVERHEEYPYDVPWMEYPVDQPARNFVRKAQCHFGWDWSPYLPTMGIWRSVELLGYSEPRIVDVASSQYHDGDDVTLDVSARVDAPTAGRYRVSAAVAGSRTARTAELDAGENEVALRLSVPGPDLWWPRDLGDQPLYDLTVSVGAAEQTERIGFREVDLVREADDRGESYYLSVNGEPVFAKGANWVPAELLHGRFDESQYDRLLDSAVAANMNAVRVWGGGQYERDGFYERCDERGLLVLHDFTFACSAYPANEAFCRSVAREARHQVRRLSTHPSLAVWFGNNEVETALSSWFSAAEPRDRLAGDYEHLFHDLLPGVVAEEDPETEYWPSSPSSGIAATTESSGDHPDPGVTRDSDRGTAHDWRIWHEGAPFDAYESVVHRFVAEFGYQSFPSVETLRDVVPADQLNPTAPLVEYRQRPPEGNDRILTRMADHFRYPFDVESFAFLSQLQQVLAMQTAVEHWRWNRPECMGTLFWQLNDVWPCPSWSAIEYDGTWKPLQHAARRFFAPVLVSTTVEDDRLEVWVTNDERDRVAGELTVRTDTFRGERVFEAGRDVAVDGGTSRRVASYPVEAVTGGTDEREVLVRAALDSGAETYPARTVLDRYKRLSLPDPDVRVAVSGREVTVDAERAALFLTLDADAEGRFSDNCFHLPAGESRTVRFEGDATNADLAGGLSVTHLRDTYGRDRSAVP